MPFISAALTAIGTSIGLAAGTGLATFVAIGQAAIGIGINFVVGKIQQDQAKKAAKKTAGTQFDREYGENISRKVACGYVGIAGHDIYVNTYSTSNRWLEQVYVFSDFPCDGLSRIWAGGKLLDLEDVDGSGKFFEVINNPDYEGRMRFTFYDGTQTAADNGLVENSNPTGRWTEDHVGHGMCYVKVRLFYNRERLNSFPDFFFEIRGARLYDPRKDSTVGGSGAHRWGNYATYEFTENPVIMDYNYRRGFAWNGDMFCGMDMNAEDLPVARYATAANICDEMVSGERRYRCSVLLDCDVDHGDNIDALMESCGGMVIDSVDGSWPLIGTEQPIVATFTDEDLIVGENVRFQRRRSMADLVNSVGGTYPEPANMWSPAGYDTQTNTSQVALDRRTRDLPINFETVPSKRQANQLASIYYNENRYEAT
ncbi:MAG TPA: phage tail protein, partial [Pseudorhizobium sp.]|nr:phage tail protein [Pseudorhizobium sp.]